MVGVVSNGFELLLIEEDLPVPEAVARWHFATLSPPPESLTAYGRIVNDLGRREIESISNRKRHFVAMLWNTLQHDVTSYRKSTNTAAGNSGA